MTRIHVKTANVYVANRRKTDAADAFAADVADVIGTQESWWLHGIPGYRRFRAATLAGHHTVQNAIFLRSGYDYEGHGAYRVTHGIPGDKFAPDRWIVWLRFRAENGHRLCAIDTHINAVIQRRSGKLRPGPRLAQAEIQMRALYREIREQRAAGYDPIVTLDANYARKARQRRLWRWSPHRTFARAGLDYYAHGIDGIAVPRGSRIAEAGRYLIPGSNHAGFELIAEIPNGRQ